MNAPEHSLFRKEALQRQTSRAHGDVHIAVPLAWHVIGGFLFVSVTVAAIFLTLGSYSRYENVTGTFALDLGTAYIMPTRTGMVSALHANEGQQKTSDPDPTAS